MRQHGWFAACGSALLSIVTLLSACFLVAQHHSFWSRPAFQVALTARPLLKSLLDDTASSTRQKTDRLVTAEPEVALALMDCLRLLAPATADVVPVGPLREGDCGTLAPVFLRSLGDQDKVAFDPPLLLTCPMVAALHRWLETTVQIAAREVFKSPVVRIIGTSYSCRTAYFRADTRLSQHAFANAIDLPVFVLANGQQLDIAKEWGATRRDFAVAKTATVVKPATRVADSVPSSSGAGRRSLTVPVKAGAAKTSKATTSYSGDASTREAKFWRRIHRSACEHFSTVLGPEANETHRDHLHLDLQSRGSSKVCQ